MIIIKQQHQKNTISWMYVIGKNKDGEFGLNNK